MSQEIDTRYNEANEIVKYQFFRQLKHKRENDKNPKERETVVKYANAIHEFEVATRFKDFKKFTGDEAIIFKEHLLSKKNKVTKKNIAVGSYVHALQYIRELLEYLVKNHKEYANIKQADIEYLYPTDNEKNTATATSIPKSYLVLEILSTIRTLSTITEIQFRNKAMISLKFLTGARIRALMTTRIDSIIFLEEYHAWAFEQDPKRGISTKNRKYIMAFFIGQCQDIIDNILKWREYLIEKGFKGSDPLFPKNIPSFTDEGRQTMVLQKEPIASDSRVRDIFKAAFIANGLKYINPHNFRHTMARAMKKMPNGVELSIALAQNLGQKNEMPVLYSSYGGDYLSKQAELMKGFLLE